MDALSPHVRCHDVVHNNCSYLFGCPRQFSQCTFIFCSAHRPFSHLQRLVVAVIRTSTGIGVIRTATIRSTFPDMEAMDIFPTITLTEDTTPLTTTPIPLIMPDTGGVKSDRINVLPERGEATEKLSRCCSAFSGE